MSIAERIKELRTNKAVTQKQLSDYTGISLQSVINYENGRREPNSKAMVALERFFGVSGEYLRGESDQPDAQYSWQDSETMDVVREELSPLLVHLQSQLETFSDFEQKMVFDIFVEMSHAFNCAGEPDPDRRVYLETLQRAFFITNNYLDCLLRSAGNGAFEAERIQQAQDKAAADYAAALVDAVKTLGEPG